jgi:DNA-binding transcriptional MerR regulator
MDRSEPLTIDDLAQQAGVPVRTVRYYISQGLLPGPDGRGKAATYDADHLARLRLIRRLADGHVPLAEQRERLERLSPGEVRALLDEDQRQAADLQRASQAPSPRGYISGLLDRARHARRTARTSQPERRSARSAGGTLASLGARAGRRAPRA